MRNIIRNRRSTQSVIPANAGIPLTCFTWGLRVKSAMTHSKSAMTLSIITILIILLSACEEAKRFEISADDTTPPGRPVFIDSEPLRGGARVFFRAPDDEDALCVEASYISAAGKNVRYAASIFADFLDVYGFDSEGEHTIELCAVDLSGNRSASVRETVIALEPPVVTVAKSVQVLSSFAAMLLKWTDSWQEPVYVSVDFSYIQNGARHNATTVFATTQTETRAIEGFELYNDELLSVKVHVKDKYDNIVLAKDTTIVLLVDNVIGKATWSFPNEGTAVYGITQASGLNMNMVVDGIVEIDVPGNYFITTQNNPWNIIIDLGDRYEISRIVTHQRWSTFTTQDPRGLLYQGDNVLAYNLYGWDDTSMTWEEWWLRRDLILPVVIDPSEYEAMARAGDMNFIYPEEPRFTKPVRWFRFEAITGKSISEITLYGRNAR